MLAEGLGLSGIVSILFTGVVMKHYTFSNLSESSQRFVAAFFHLISSLAETFIFIYMGFDIAIKQHSLSHVGFIFSSILFIVVASRFVSSGSIALQEAFSCISKFANSTARRPWKESGHCQPSSMLSLAAVLIPPKNLSAKVLSNSMQLGMVDDQVGEHVVTQNKEVHQVCDMCM